MLPERLAEPHSELSSDAIRDDLQNDGNPCPIALLVLDDQETGPNWWLWLFFLLLTVASL